MDPLFDQPENAGALRYLAHGRTAVEATFGRPPADVDRWRLGTHPDVVDWLWDTLDAALPRSARWLVYDGPALVHPESAVILAAGIGTEYAVRLTPSDSTIAEADGFQRTHAFGTTGTFLDLAATLGTDWVFGRFDEREPAWLRTSYAEHGG